MRKDSDCLKRKSMRSASLRIERNTNAGTIFSTKRIVFGVHKLMFGSEVAIRMLITHRFHGHNNWIAEKAVRMGETELCVVCYAGVEK